MLKAAGAEDIKIGRELLPEGWSIHEIGTARMGNDPKTSVTDKFCRLHDVPNVYLADAEPVRLRRHAEHDVVDPRHVLADDGLPERGDADGPGLTRPDPREPSGPLRAPCAAASGQRSLTASVDRTGNRRKRV